MNRLAADPSSVLRRHEIDVLWINTETQQRHEQARRRITEIGLDPDQVFFQRGAATPSLHERLGVVGSPWVFLVLPTGHAVFEVPYHSNSGWSDDVERILTGATSSAESLVAERTQP